MALLNPICPYVYLLFRGRCIPGCSAPQVARPDEEPIFNPDNTSLLWTLGVYGNFDIFLNLLCAVTVAVTVL